MDLEYQRPKIVVDFPQPGIKKVKKVKADIALHGNPISELYGTSLAIWDHLPPYTSERAPPNSSHAGWYSIYLPRRDGRLS